MGEALESVFAQDFRSFEVVFVDDGSTDGTGEIAQSFPVRYVHQTNRVCRQREMPVLRPLVPR